MAERTTLDGNDVLFVLDYSRDSLFYDVHPRTAVSVVVIMCQGVVTCLSPDCCFSGCDNVSGCSDMSVPGLLFQ
jgi:hypothetical protein